MTGPAILVMSCNDTSPLVSSGVTSAGIVMEPLIRIAALCVVLKVFLLAAIFTVGDLRGRA